MDYKINSLIAALLAIANYAKDIHYNCGGKNFYGNHLFADRIQENLAEFIDQLKEICLLGHSLKPLRSSEYLSQASGLIPSEINFSQMKTLILNALALIESISDISKGDENLIGNIAQDLQFNPIMKKYDKVLNYIKNYEGGPMDKETKGIFNSLIEALKARNKAG